MQAQSYRSDLAWRWLCTAISSFFSTPRFFSNTIIHKNRRIEATLDGINPINAGKKKEEALAMLKKWFPQMENFSGQLKKYTRSR